MSLWGDLGHGKKSEGRKLNKKMKKKKRLNEDKQKNWFGFQNCTYIQQRRQHLEAALGQLKGSSDPDLLGPEGIRESDSDEESQEFHINTIPFGPGTRPPGWGETSENEDTNTSEKVFFTETQMITATIHPINSLTTEKTNDSKNEAKSDDEESAEDDADNEEANDTSNAAEQILSKPFNPKTNYTKVIRAQSTTKKRKRSGSVKKREPYNFNKQKKMRRQRKKQRQR